jgi:hypothetical protein
MNLQKRFEIELARRAAGADLAKIEPHAAIVA